jgi:hypothetical protein
MGRGRWRASCTGRARRRAGKVRTPLADDSFSEAHEPTMGLERQFRAWPAAKPPTQLLGLPAYGLLERLLVRAGVEAGLALGLRRAVGPLLHRRAHLVGGRRHRHREPLAGRNVDEGAAAPARFVSRHERVLGRDNRPEVRLDELRVALDRHAQRHDTGAAWLAGPSDEGSPRSLLAAATAKIRVRK